MNIKTKTTLVIVFTLITGILIGALLYRALLQNRVQHVFSMRNPNAFVQSYLETIKPNPGQEKQIKAILKRNGDQMAEIRSKSREDLEISMATMLSELESVLTPEQIQRIEEKPLGGRSRFGMRSSEEELAFLTQELSLTEEQTAQLKKILEEFRMSPRDKKQQVTPMEMSQNFRQQREKREEEIKKILTDVQKKKYDDLMRDRQKRQPGNVRNFPF
jgi:Spy/CpxP family protein refolding chaperone